jgi:hypothetical protein
LATGATVETSEVAVVAAGWVFSEVSDPPQAAIENRLKVARLATRIRVVRRVFVLVTDVAATVLFPSGGSVVR